MLYAFIVRRSWILHWDHGLNLCHVWKMCRIIPRIIALTLWLGIFFFFFFFSEDLQLVWKLELKLIYRNESLKKKLAICIQLNLFPVVFMTIGLAFQIPPVVKAYKILCTGWIWRLFFSPRINGHLWPLFFITQSFSFSRRWRVIFSSEFDKLPCITMASVSHCSPWDCGHRQRRPQPPCPCSAWDFPSASWQHRLQVSVRQ